jgi:hypothetical protein
VGYAAGVVAYMHCPSCERTAWLDSETEPPLVCRHCDAPLAPMPTGMARSLVSAVRKRFERDSRLDVAHTRFVRD